MNSLKNPMYDGSVANAQGINISTFTFRCYELETSNIYEHITRIDLTLDSIPPFFSSLKTSSPKKRETFNIPNSELTFNSRRSHHLSSNPYEVSAKKNLRIMTVLLQKHKR
jgi:hypothetical protein